MATNNKGAAADSAVAPDVEVAEAPMIVTHDGERMPLDEFNAADSDETFVVGADGKRVKRSKWKD